MNDDIDVLVVGAGPVGLFCANELLRHGLTCRIIDKKSGLSEQSKALGLHIRTLDLLDDCGFLEEVMRQGHKVRGVLFKSGGKNLVNATFSEIKAPHQHLIDLPQSKTEAILYQGLHDKGHEVEWETELTKFSQSASGVAATVKKTNGHLELIKANWLIACDGAHSTSRHLLNAPFKGAKYPQNWWLADVEIDWKMPEDRMVIYISKEGPLACFPMGNKRYRVVLSATDNLDSDPTLHDIQEAFSQRSHDLATVSHPIWLSQFTFHSRQIEQYQHQRVLFAGDSAHVHSPIGGQGLNTGLQDIYNLVWKLALVQKKQAKPQMLNTYQTERHPVGENILKKTEVMTKMIVLKNPVLIGLRNAFIKTLFHFKSLRKIMIKDIAELSISYRKSPLVNHYGHIKEFNPGEYCPEFTLYDPDKKSDVTSSHFLKGHQHQLLLFTGPQNKRLDELLQLINDLHHPYKHLLQVHLILNLPDPEIHCEGRIWHDKDQMNHQRFAIDQASLVLVRPDKYLGLVQNPVNKKQLFKHLQQWLIKYQ